jgi:hypothetical protein
MTAAPESLPSDLASAHAMIRAERAARRAAEAVAAVAQAEAAYAQADLSNTQALIAHLKLEIEKLRRTMYGPRAERQARLIDQLELQLEELEAAATEDELAAEAAAQKTQAVRSLKRKRPVRKPFPDDIWRERGLLAAVDRSQQRSADLRCTRWQCSQRRRPADLGKSVSLEVRRGHEQLVRKSQLHKCRNPRCWRILCVARCAAIQPIHERPRCCVCGGHVARGSLGRQRCL